MLETMDKDGQNNLIDSDMLEKRISLVQKPTLSPVSSLIVFHLFLGNNTKLPLTSYEPLGMRSISGRVVGW